AGQVVGRIEDGAHAVHTLQGDDDRAQVAGHAFYDHFVGGVGLGGRGVPVLVGDGPGTNAQVVDLDAAMTDGILGGGAIVVLDAGGVPDVGRRSGREADPSEREPEDDCARSSHVSASMIF